MDKISIKTINIVKNRLEIRYFYDELCSQYFKSNLFYAEYNKDISNVPSSIAVIPFISQILPISWLGNYIIEVDELDEDFYNSIPHFKEGYKKMYPMLSFKGDLRVNKIIKNVNSHKNKATFFSGGVDAFSTLIAHIKESPNLVTIWGADIPTVDITGWNNVREQVLKVGELFGLESFFIKSNFTEILNFASLQSLIVGSQENWWHGFQNGIGIISLAAPLVWKNGYSTLYIASSYTQKDNATCASHPTIDNNVRFCECNVVHDQFELNRLEKIKQISNYSNTYKRDFFLRVCYIIKSGYNCCNCEKCLRTAYALAVLGNDCKRFGFNKNDLFKNSKLKVLRQMSPLSVPFWMDIQNFMLQNPKKSYPSDILWIRSCNFEKEYRSLRIRAINFIARRLKKFLRISI